MGKTLIVGLVLAAILQAESANQEGKHQMARPMAKVLVVAFEAGGRFLGAPNISAFTELDDHQNLASKFRAGIATDVPYGSYRIEGRLPAYYSDVKVVRVYQPVVTVVLGLRFAAELPEVPPSIRGRVIGLSTPLDKTFVKLVGVYENEALESAVGGDGSFEIGGLSPGRFLLLVIGEDGILASQTLSIPYTGPPLEIEIKNQPLPAGKMDRVKTAQPDLRDFLCDRVPVPESKNRERRRPVRST